MNDTASVAASSIWRSRSRSSIGLTRGSRGILRPRLAHHLVSEMPRKEPRCLQVHLTSQQLAEFYLHAAEVEQTRSGAAKLEQHVDVTCRAKVLTQNGPEQRQFPHPVAPTELRQPV